MPDDRAIPPELPSEWMPHFEWLDELLSDSREVVAGLLWEPLFPLDQLRAQIIEYREEIRSAGIQADHHLGNALACNALALVDRLAEDACDLNHRLGQIAIRYFVLDDDGDDDLMSPFGFDDDVEVFNAVVGRLGYAQLLIDD